jgi:GT2 family glycosyltransferase
MLVSVIITTYNRPQQLAVTLKMLARQSRLPNEVIVVDSGSNAEYGKVINTFQHELPLHYQRIECSTIAHGRNTGISMAIGDIIAFTDDDCIPDDDWLDILARPFEIYDTLGQVGGAICNNSPDPNPAEKFADQRFNVLLSQYERGLLGSSVDYPFSYFFATANTAFRRSALDDIGGFDKACITGEDVDCSVRLIKQGWQLYYEPAAIVQHCYRKTIKELLAQFTAYGFGKAYLFYKHSYIPYRLIIFRYGRHHDNPMAKPYLNTQRIVLRSPIAGFINWHGMLALTLRMIFTALLLFFVMGTLFGFMIGSIMTLFSCAFIGRRSMIAAMKLLISGNAMQLVIEQIVPLKESWTAFVAGLQRKIVFID